MTINATEGKTGTGGRLLRCFDLEVKAMISAWWLIPAVMAGAVVGVFLVALCFAVERPEDETKKEVKK